MEFRLITYWNEAHFSVVSRVELKSSNNVGKERSLKKVGVEFEKLFRPLATLKGKATRNAGTKGREAMNLSAELNGALKTAQRG